MFKRLKKFILEEMQDASSLYKIPFFIHKQLMCPICGGDGTFEYINKCTELDRCLRCGHVYSRRLPKDRILNLTYGKFSYWLEDKSHQGITTVKPGPEWDEFLGARIGIMERCNILTPDARLRIFEVGCSGGMLLYGLQQKGHDVTGSEMNKAIAEEGSKNLGVKIISKPFEKIKIPPGSYDITISFHTIEHLCSPMDTFRKMAHILKDDGAVLVEVPYGEEEYENIDHLHFFNKKSLKILVESFFKEAEIIGNSYTNSSGRAIMSLYAVGRYPKL